MKRVVALGLFLLVALAGCESPKPQTGEAAPEGSMETTSSEESPATAPAGKVPASEAPQPSLPALPPLSPGELKRLLTQASNHLDAGEEDKARVELERASQSNPKDDEVRCLLSGITTADPLAAYGKDARTHTVARGESLGTIARTYTGKVCEFYAIARYNNIRVPKQISVGQTIRIPLTMVVNTPPKIEIRQDPPKAEPPKPPPKPEPPRSEPVKPEAAKPEAPKPEPPKAPRTDAAEVDRLYRNGISAYQRHDLRGAIGLFNQVLSINPGHGGASTYRQRALDECARLNKISPGSCVL